MLREKLNKKQVGDSYSF